MGRTFYGHTDQPKPLPTLGFANVVTALLLTAKVCEITRKEATEAVIVLKNKKVASWDEITGEMLKHGGEDLVTRLVMFSCA